MVGIYSTGGGTDGIVQALRETDRAGGTVFVCNELTPANRSGLIDGVIDLVISTPVARLAERAVAAMVEAAGGAQPGGASQLLVPLELFVAESF